MGLDAVEINNKLSEVLRPIVARLCAIGVLQNRDYQTVWVPYIVIILIIFWETVCFAFLFQMIMPLNLVMNVLVASSD